MLNGEPGASVNTVTQTFHTPYSVLVSTVISLRTKDEVTLPASHRLLEKAGNPEELRRLSREEIEKLIYPAGFFRNKAKQLQTIGELLVRDHNGIVPDNLEELLTLPGVGRKTANLVLGIGFGIPAICVDTHVHRIPNRIGWIETRTPEESETALQAILPKRWWIPINELLVRYGQKICTPRSPFCSRCPLDGECLHRDVLYRR